MHKGSQLLVNDSGHITIMALCSKPVNQVDLRITAGQKGVKNFRRTLQVLVNSGIIEAVDGRFDYADDNCKLVLTEAGTSQLLEHVNKTVLELQLLSNLAYAADVSMQVIIDNAHSLAWLLSNCRSLNDKRSDNRHV